MTNIVKVSCLALALVAATAYVLMGVGVLKPGNLSSDNMPVFYYVIPAGYVAMGVAVFLKKRWLLITDAVLAAFTILVFYAKYASQPDVLWSAPGLITKIAQVLMLAGLIYLIIKTRSEKSAVEAK